MLVISWGEPGNITSRNTDFALVSCMLLLGAHSPVSGCFPSHSPSSVLSFSHAAIASGVAGFAARTPALVGVAAHAASVLSAAAQQSSEAQQSRRGTLEVVGLAGVFLDGVVMVLPVL
jgi:hypothetical protein